MKKIKYKEQYSILSDYMEKRYVNRQLQGKINNYLLYATKIESAFQNEQAVKIIETFPEQIREDLRKEIHSNIIKHWPIFLNNF